MPAALLLRKLLLLVKRGDPLLVRENPYLQEVDGFGVRGVALAVAHSAARRHVLHDSGADHPASPAGILMLQGSSEHHGDDLHIPVGVCAKSPIRVHLVLVDHSHSAKAHMGRIHVAGEGKGVTGVQPTVVEVTAVLGAAGGDHLTFSPKAFVEPHYSSPPGSAGLRAETLRCASTGSDSNRRSTSFPARRADDE